MDSNVSVRLTDAQDGGVQRESLQEMLRMGAWYWVKCKKGDWLACAMDIGTNYVQVQAPDGCYLRLHFDEVNEMLRPATDAETHIQLQINQGRANVNRIMSEINRLTLSLGLKDVSLPPAQQPTTQDTP